MVKCINPTIADIITTGINRTQQIIKMIFNTVTSIATVNIKPRNSKVNAAVNSSKNIGLPFN